MQGLLVVGAVHGADVAGVGAGLRLALARAGTEARELVAVGRADPAASPLTVARHAGAALDPAALVAALRTDGDGAAPTIVLAAGGLLAPLTPRYSVRDLATALGLPLVVCVPAGPDLVNLARLTAGSARGAGLAVAAVALTGWPDPPDRVLLDEQRLLEELAGAPVVTLPAASSTQPDAGRSWPAGDWLAAAAERAEAGAATVPAGTPGPSRTEVVLEPYDAWPARAMGDPRSTPRPALMSAMLEIVAAEGPMRAGRAYAVYNRAAGGKKLTTIARAPLSSAVYWLSREGRLALTRAEEIPWQEDDLVRTPDAPPVRVRELGPRTLEEVPLDEIAELMRRLRAAGHASGEAGLKRAVLAAYGLVRLTGRADEYLGLAHGLLEP